VRAARELTEADWLIRWFGRELDQLATLQAMVDGKRLRPGSTASGLFYDIPPDLQEDAFADAVAALDEVDRLYSNGLDAAEWDWSRGFPPGWPSSLKERLRSYFPAHRA
jgi:hypothetical protein